jgi:uncharacterized protein DUF1203
MKLDVRPLPGTIATSEVEVSIDPEGGAPLRCCLRDSRPGERIALASVTPPGPQGAYAESGPVFLHADPCGGPDHPGYPDEFRRRVQVFRAYSADGRIVGGRVVRPEDDQEAVAEELLGEADVAYLHSRNLVHGCYMFAIHPAA